MTGSMWMSVTAFVSAGICFLNWIDIDNWTKDIKVGLWMFSILSLAFATTTLQQKSKGKIISGISIAVAAITILILIGKM